MNRPTILGFALAVTFIVSSCLGGDPGFPDDDPPTAIILTPGSFDVFSVYEPITFSGKATDLQDGNDCCVATFKWSFVGSARTVGTGLSFVTDSVPIGNTTNIRLDVTDLDGNAGSNTRGFSVDVGAELLFGANSESEIHRTDGLFTTMLVLGQNPAWSPDGSRIAFAANDGTDLEIFIVDPDGTTNLIQVTDNSDSDSKPTWSPDGTRLAYTSDIMGNLDIWTIDVMTRATTQITTDPANDDEADWTGTVIVFYSERDAEGDKEIFKVNDDLSSAPVQLTFNTVEDRDPQWTPNGAQILFSRDAGDSEIYIMSANGSGQTNLTNNSAEDTDPQISPDLTKIAFISDRAFDGNLWVMRPDGSQPIQVERLNARDPLGNPRWHP